MGGDILAVYLFMKYIKDLKENENLIDYYLCKQKQTLKTRSGRNYLSLKLQDKTGVIDAKVWELNNDIQNFEVNDIIKIDATVVSYQNELQINIRKLRKSREAEVLDIDFIPCSEKDINEMLVELKQLIKTFKNSYIRTLLENIFVNKDSIITVFAARSAGKSMHHSYLGGLVEHTLSVAQICDFMADKYKHVSRDLLVASAILHDLGKIVELSDFPANDYTDDGKLLGHIYIGTEIVSQEINKIEGFPSQLASLLKHCLLSHHGEYIYGSPKRPKIIEAMILNCADNLDAKAKSFEETINADNSQNCWVGYHKLLDRNIRRSNVEQGD